MIDADDTTPCGAPAVDLSSCELEPCPPTLSTGESLPPLAPWSAEDTVTEADYAAVGRIRPLPPPTDAPFRPGVT